MCEIHLFQKIHSALILTLFQLTLKKEKRLQCFLKCLLQRLETLTHAQMKEFSFIEKTRRCGSAHFF